MIKNTLVKTWLYIAAEVIFLIAGTCLIYFENYVAGVLFLVTSVRIFITNQSNLSDEILSLKIERAVLEIKKELKEKEKRYQ